MSGLVIDRIDLPDDAASIVLYDWAAGEVRDGRNLVRVDREGRIVWKAAPPTTGMQDCFTAMQWDGEALTAHTWSCYLVRIDPKNGDVTVLRFTK